MSPPLAEWDSFYVIVGSSAAALTGLMFVVITLIADSNAPGSSRTIAAFGTPTIVHFSAALLISAALSAPWPTLFGAGVAVAVCGIGGVIYTVLVVHQAYTQTEYKPVFEDWLWHGAMPVAAYVVLLVGAIKLPRAAVPALFSCAAATIGLVLIGIHNAWDTVTYVALEYRTTRKDA
jgi:hypothetical protein